MYGISSLRTSIATGCAICASAAFWVFQGYLQGRYMETVLVSNKGSMSQAITAAG